MMAGERCATRLATAVAGSNLTFDLKLETAECRRHGYILTGRFLGQGAYAKVFLGQATWPKINTNRKLRDAAEYGKKEMKVAIKIISTESAPKAYIQKFLPREIAAMNRCYKHANVLQLYDIFATVKRVYLILEFATAGDLLTYINSCCARSSSRCVSEEVAKGMFMQIAAGLQFIHKRGIAHRDLKCENVLLTGTRSIKLSDFGFATETNHRENLKTHCGSYAYAPPEILKQQKYDGRKADLWSLGVVLFAMVNGGLPFKESEAKAVLEAMKNPVYFRTHLSTECKELIRGLLRIKPQSRLSLDEVFAHPWLRNMALPTSSSESFDRVRHVGKGDTDALLKQHNDFLEPSSVSKFLSDSMKPHKPRTHWRYTAINAGIENHRGPDPTSLQRTAKKAGSEIPKIVPKDTKYTESFPVISRDCVTGDKDERSCGEPKCGVTEIKEKASKSTFVKERQQSAVWQKPVEIKNSKLDRLRDVVAKVADLLPLSLPPPQDAQAASPKTKKGNSCPKVETSNTNVAKEIHRHAHGRQTASPNVVNICIDKKNLPKSYDVYQRLVPARNEEKRKKAREIISKSPRKKKPASQGQPRNIDKRTREECVRNSTVAHQKILRGNQPPFDGAIVYTSHKQESNVAEERFAKPPARPKAKSTSPPVSVRSARYAKKQQECRLQHDVMKTGQQYRVPQKFRTTEKIPRMSIPKKPNFATDSTTNKQLKSFATSRYEKTPFADPPCKRTNASPKRPDHEEGLAVDSQGHNLTGISAATGGDMGGYVQIRPFSRCPRGLAIEETLDVEKKDLHQPGEPWNACAKSVWRTSPEPKYASPHACHGKAKANELISLGIRRQRSYHRVSDDPRCKQTHGAYTAAPASRGTRSTQQKHTKKAGSADSAAKDTIPRQSPDKNNTWCSRPFKTKATSRLLYKRLQEPRGTWHAHHQVSQRDNPFKQTRDYITVGGSQPMPSCGVGLTATRPKTEHSVRSCSSRLPKSERTDAVVLKLRKSDAGGGGEKQFFKGSVIAALVD